MRKARMTSDNLNEAFSKEAHERSWRFGYEAGIKAAKESQESLIKQARKNELESLLNNSKDYLPKETQRINAKTGRVEFMEEHKIIHDWVIQERLAELEGDK